MSADKAGHSSLQFNLHIFELVNNSLRARGQFIGQVNRTGYHRLIKFTARPEIRTPTQTVCTQYRCESECVFVCELACAHNYQTLEPHT